MRRYELSKLFNRDGYYDLDSFFSKDTFALDVKDEDDKYIVEAELPGFNKEDVSASLVNHWLEIVATKNKEINENDKYLYQERSTTTLKRKIYLNDAINEKINAELVDGILKMTIPKQTTNIEQNKIEIK